MNRSAVSATCQWCGKTIAGYGNKFCSLSCSVSSQNRTKWTNYNPLSECLQCGAEFPIRGVSGGKKRRFCSKSCSATYNNAKRPKKQCSECGAAIGRQRTYCSARCFQAKRNRDLVRGWLDGITTGSAGRGVANFVKGYLISQRGEFCWECGWSKIHPTTGKVPIEVDHIDGNSSNNRPENLRLLCPNCHSLTPTFRALNKGKGRTGRK